MNYGRLIRRSLDLTFRYRFLWVLGLFAFNTGGTCTPSFNLPDFDVGAPRGPVEAGPLPAGLERIFADAVRWLAQNPGVILLAAASILVLSLLFVVLSVIAQGGMARATTELALGRASSLGRAWRGGLALFWRFVGLWLVLLALGIAAMLVIAAEVGLVVVGVQATSGVTRAVLIAIAVLLGLATMLAAFAAIVGITVVTNFAQRAIALEELGPLSALAAGYRLVRRNLGESAIVWLISLALGIGTGLVLTLGVMIALVALGGLGVMLVSTTGPSTLSIFYSIIAGVAFTVFLWLLSAVSSTYFWNYWTLVYLELSERLAGPTEARSD